MHAAVREIKNLDKTGKMSGMTERATPTDDYGAMTDLPNLDRFIAAKTDDERMALGIDVLRSALSEATSSHLLGWEEAVHEFVRSWPDAPNRPL